MSAALRPYRGDDDFMRVRQFLIDTFAMYGWPFNWAIDHWSFCRFHVLDLHSYYNVSHFGVPADLSHHFRHEQPAWEQTVGVWEDKGGEIVAVVNTENDEPGEAWFQIHPDFTWLYPEMVSYVEERLACRVDGVGYVKLYVNCDTELEEIASERGYRPVGSLHTWHEYRIDKTPAPRLPEGFRIRSVADEDDVERRRRAKALAFGGHYCPTDWPPASAFEEMRRSPDYRPDLDLFVVAPNGDYASFCTVWVDEANRYADFEPVGTHVEYRRLGLARAVMMEGFRRMAERGAVRSFMEANPGFYRQVGFEPTPHGYREWVKYFDLGAGAGNR